jgi:hypothetical protein
MSVAPLMSDDPLDRPENDVERAEGRDDQPYSWLALEARRDAVRREKKKKQSLVFGLIAFLCLHAALWTNSWPDSHRLDVAALAWAGVLGALAIYVYPRRP